MRKQMKKIIVGGVILAVLGCGSAVVYHGINRSASEPTEEATATDAYALVETATENNKTTEVLADNDKDKESITEQTENADSTKDEVSDIKNGKKDDVKNPTSTTEGNKPSESKPSTTEGSKPAETKPENKPSTNDGSKPSTTESPKVESTTTEHQHVWKEVKVKKWVAPKTHTETQENIVQEAGYVTKYREECHGFCRYCGDLGEVSTDYMVAHCIYCTGGGYMLVNGSYIPAGSSYWFEAVDVPYQEYQDAIIEKSTITVTDEAGHYEEVLDHYECSCGATKSK